MATFINAVKGRNPSWLSNITGNMSSTWENLLLECGNHLHLGHWELFCGLAMSIINHQDHPEGRALVLDMLNNIYQHPEIFGAGSSNFDCDTNPCDIFWLCAQFYREICDDNKDRANEMLTDAGFRHALGCVCNETNNLYIKEIYSIFQAFQAGQHITSPLLSPGATKFIVNLMKTNSKTGATIFEALLRLEKSKFSCHHLELLLCLYTSLDKCLTELEFACGSSFQQEMVDTDVEKESIYSLLTLCESFGSPYIPMEEGNSDRRKTVENDILYFRMNLDAMLGRIWQLCERGVLRKSSIILALLSHEDLWMIKHLCHLEDKTKARLEQQENQNLSAESFLRLIYSRCGQLNIKELFLHSVVNGSHFLEYFLNSCIELISSGQPLLACGVLRDPVLGRLKPLVLLLSWTRVKTIPDVVKFVDAFEILYSVKMEADPELDVTCRRLVCKAKLMLWVLNNSCSKKHINHSGIAAFLANLQSLSSLHILNCTQIELIDRQQLDTILKTWTSTAPVGTPESPAEEESFAKPMLQKECAYEMQSQIEQMRDQMLILGYYIMYDFIRIIEAGIKLEQLITEFRNNHKVVKVKKTVTPPLEDNLHRVSAESLTQFYESSIVVPLKAVREEVSSLFPLNYRVEILENAFSLLFVTHRNVKEGSAGCSVSDSSDEGHEGDEKLPGVDESNYRSRSITTAHIQERSLKKSMRCRHTRSMNKSTGSIGKAGSHETQQSSENASSRSTGSANGNVTHIGFLCNQFIVRDVLSCLKQCIFDATTVSKERSSLDIQLAGVVLSSVEEKTLVRRLSSLSRYVMEAQWRFQLVADDWIPKDYCAFPVQSVIEGPRLQDDWTHHFYEEIQSEDEDDDDDNKEVNISSSKGSSAVVMELSPEVRRKVSTAHRKLSHSSKSGNPLLSEIATKGIIMKMLAPHESLLNICLNQNDLAKAEQVIKIFGMEHTRMATDVAFALDYEKALHQLIKLAMSRSPLKPGRPSARGINQQRSTWESIVKAAQFGMDAAAAETLIADELLASHKVPGIAEAEKVEFKTQFANWLPESIDWRAFVRADLALVACSKAHACRNLLEASYSALCSNSGSIPAARIVRTRLPNQRRGILSFIEDMLTLISPELDPADLKEDLQGNSNADCCGVRDILLQAQHPLTLKSYQKNRSTWKHASRVINQLDTYLELEQKQENYGECNPVTSTSTSPNTSAMYLQNRKTLSEHPCHREYRKLMKLAATLRLSLEEEFFYQAMRESSQMKLSWDQKCPAYLCSLYDYVKNLATVLPQLDTGQLVLRGSYFSMFRQSPTSILENLVFSNSVPPKQLEIFAKKLNLNLLQIIIYHCCPNIPAVSKGPKCIHGISEYQPNLKKADSTNNLEETYEYSSSHNLPSSRKSAMSEELLYYVEEKCWLAAVLVRALGYLEVTAPEHEVAEAVHGDPVILHPVLHRFLERRTQLDSNHAKCVPLALHPHMCIEHLVLTIQSYINDENWVAALTYLNSWECRNPLYEKRLNPFRNLILSTLSQKVIFDTTSESCFPWTYVLQIKDVLYKSKIVLEQYENWSADGVLETVNDCIANYFQDDEIYAALKLCLRRVEVYNSVLQFIASNIIKVNVGHCTTALNLCTWQDIAQMADSNISDLVDSLVSAKKYNTVVEMNEFHKLPEEKQLIANNCRVLALLEGPLMNPTMLQKALENASHPQERYSISLHILDYICESSVDFSLLLCILEKVDLSGVTEVERFQFFRKKIGIKIFLCLPIEERGDYKDLITHPHIMLEQLLINIKIETLQRAFQTIRDDLKLFTTDSFLSFEAINSILEVYATKAVDFRVVQTTIPGVSRNATGTINAEKVAEKQIAFSVPQRVPTKQQWVSDDSVLECMICSIERFSMFNRRHHCRRCGRVCCSLCSQRRMKVHGYKDVPVRICDDCYAANSAGFTHEYVLSSTPDTLEKRLKAHYSGGSLDGSNNLSSEYITSSTDYQLSNSRNSAWKLSLDASHNITAREEFSYEQAPSISLCLSICDLHWDQHASGHKLLSFAKTLFSFLKPISPGVVNPEIDYGLIISMLKSVLLSAKVKFSKAFDNVAVTRCDIYFGLADLLNLLVSSNCKHLIPTEDLTKDDISSFPYTRLRKLLMKEERWVLALEISTKGGLDVSEVWVAWGMVCLQMGHFSTAREKFSHCLQKDVKKRKQSGTLLIQILQQLESSSMAVYNESAVTTSLLKLKSLKIGVFPVQNSSHSKLNPVIRDECVYYLNTYGSHATCLAFYVRHNEWEIGLKTVLDKACPANVFVEEFVMPCLRKSCFSEVKLTMQRLDPSLQKWATYFGALGRHLERHGLVHVLYDLQLFLKDDLRAAMTCMQFYQRGAHDYSDLNDRLLHLQQAKQHLDNFKQQHNSTSSAKRLGLSLPLKDIEKYLIAIELQVEATKFLYKKLDLLQSFFETSSTIFDASNANSPSGSKTNLSEAGFESTVDPLPTVFGNSTARAHVATMVILSGTCVTEGFPLAVRIIQEYRLHAGNVYSLTAKNLMRLKRLDDITPFLNCMKQTGGQNDELCDRVVLKVIVFCIMHGYENQDIEYLIRLLVENKNKIEALIQFGKLKSAYLLAVKDGSIDAVRKICDEAHRTSQTSVKAICEKWLSLKQKNYNS